MVIKNYPEFEPINLKMRPELHSHLSLLKDGVSEFTFANLYLFRKTYGYRVSRLNKNSYIISGKKGSETFFMLPDGLPDREILADLFKTHNYIKNLAASHSDARRVLLEQWNYCVSEDRDNFDYLYLRKDLSQLAGKKYHKKRNLVNAFINNYNYEEKLLTEDLKGDAFRILDEWNKTRSGDFEAAKEALEKKDVLGLCGYVYYVDGIPSAYVLGESICDKKCFVVHFEKALDTYKGLYQFINRAFASILPCQCKYINREQDLGDPGLRQAKMTYRPCGFIKKYRVYEAAVWPCPEKFPDCHCYRAN